MNDIFENNKQNLLLINEIVANYRKQNFFVGSLKLSALLKNINSVVEVIFSREDCRDLAGELEQILPALLQAQGNQDYILQADILEGDLLPLLQKIQIKLQEDDTPQVSDFLENNMLILKEKNERLYKVLQNVRNDNTKYVIAYAINGQPTVQARNGNRCFFMHSTMNPEWEAQVLAAGLPAAKNYVVFGMGLGYHVIELLKKYSENKVTVLESEKYLLLQALRYMDWTTYFKENRIEIVYEPDITELIGYLKQMKDYELFMHYPTVQAVENPSIRTLLEDFFITTSSMREQERFLDANFEKLSERHLPECSEIKSLFYKKNVVIVGAGPSVNQELPSLKQYRNNITIFATGHIAGTLLREGIIPDAIIITDPQPHMYQQVKGLDTKKIPLILLSTASSSVLDYYEGPVYIAYQNGYRKAEEIAEKIGAKAFETGGSVTTTALDIALQFKAEKVIFVGVDLAYTGGNSHAEGVGRRITDTGSLRKVISCSGEEIYTSKNLDIYRKWIERRIANLTGTVIYNTGNGARIEGAPCRTWDEMMGE